MLLLEFLLQQICFFEIFRYHKFCDKNPPTKPTIAVPNPIIVAIDAETTPNVDIVIVSPINLIKLNLIKNNFDQQKI